VEWISTFIQPRDGRTNLKRTRIESESTIETKETEEKEDGLENENRDIEKSSDISEDDPDRVKQRTPLINDEKEVDTKDKNSQVDGPTKSKRKPQIQGAARETLLEEIEHSMLSKINLRMNEREKRRDIKNREKVEQKELDSEDVFCQALSLDLKKLPYYENMRCGTSCISIKCRLWKGKCDRTTSIKIKQTPSPQMPPNAQTPFVILSAMHSSSPSFSSPPNTPNPNT